MECVGCSTLYISYDHIDTPVICKTFVKLYCRTRVTHVMYRGEACIDVDMYIVQRRVEVLHFLSVIPGPSLENQDDRAGR